MYIYTNLYIGDMSQPFIVGKPVTGEHCGPGQGDRKTDGTAFRSCKGEGKQRDPFRG